VPLPVVLRSSIQLKHRLYLPNRCVARTLTVISTRHSHKRSTLITTNTAFSDWGNILYNTTIATAIADRLVENSEIFLLGGESLRKGNKSQPPTE
jgi:DNA replication protein DnaC